MGFITHNGCKKIGRPCRLVHHEHVPAAKLDALGAAAQLLSIQRGGWASKPKLTAPQTREKWQRYAAKTSELGPDARDNFGGGRDGAAAGCNGPLRLFHAEAPPPNLAECDPAFLQALQCVKHPGELDLCRELLGQGRTLASVEPAEPTLRPTTAGPRPLTRAAQYAEEAKRHLPTMVARENGVFQAAAAQKAVEIALEAETRPGYSGGTRPAWRDIYAQAIRYIATHSPSPVCDQAGRCEPARAYRQGTAVQGLFVFFNERAGAEQRLPTQVLKIEDSRPTSRPEDHSVAKMWFLGQE